MSGLDPVTAAEDVRQALRAWISSATGLALASVVLEPFGARRPAVPYVGLRLTSSGRTEGHDASVVAESGGDGLEVRVGWRRATVTVNAYGEGGGGLLEALRLSVASSTQREALLASGVVVVRVGPARDASAWFGAETETRHLAEVDVRYVVEASAPVDVIESVEATISTE